MIRRSIYTAQQSKKHLQMKKNKVLLVEDDLGLSNVIINFFKDNAIDIIHTDDGGKAVPLFQNEKPNLAIIDIVLPNKSGFDIAKEIRALNSTIPILLMTGTEVCAESEIIGYELGAINYMRKPILPQVLLAQVRNLLMIPKDLKNFNFKNLKLTVQEQYLSINNSDVIKLNNVEIKLLVLLLQNESFIVQREKIFLNIWGHDSIKLNNSLDRAVLQLRSKLTLYDNIALETIYGGGYRLKIGTQ